jgi:DNA-binding transcriptional regulator GbsR (MarR family)
MNYMKKQESDARIRVLAGHVGDFIRYWGFRRIHGEIWALVYLSEAPLSGAEIVGRLRVSKALVSPALKELEDEGLIERVPSENSKVKRYAAVDDVEKVIKGVLKRREKPMLEKILKSYSALPKASLAKVGYRPDRIEAMGAMIQMAQMGLQMLLEIDLNDQGWPLET